MPRTSENQRIDFEGVIRDTISKDIRLNFKNVNLANITPNIDSLNLEGLVNGTLDYSQLNEQIEPVANLSISNFILHKKGPKNHNQFCHFRHGGWKSLPGACSDIDLEKASQFLTSVHN